MPVISRSPAEAIAHYREQAPMRADALLQRAGSGDLEAADALAAHAGISRLDALAFAQQAAEARVWGQGGDEAMHRLLANASSLQPVAGAGPLRPGGTVAHLTGFRDQLPGQPKAANGIRPFTRVGHPRQVQTADRVARSLDKYKAAGELSPRDRHWATLALRTAVTHAADTPRMSAALQEIEKEYGPVLDQVKGAIVCHQPLHYVDHDGNIAALRVHADNARDIVRMLNQIDEGLPGITYELREMALEKGHLSTFEAFTYGGIDATPKTMWDIADNPECWLPQRRDIHERLLGDAVDKALSFSATLNRDPPAVFAMRGNTAAGKTRTLVDIDALASAVELIKDEPKSTINPDNFKVDLIKHAYRAGNCAIDHHQSHVESCVIAQAVWHQLERDPNASVLVDRRLGAQSDFDEIVKSARAGGKRVELYDVDAPLEASLCGVLAREPGGDDPIPPFDAVAWGFKSIREDRLAILEQAIAEGHVDRYELYGTLPNGEKVLAFKVEGDQTTEVDADLFDATIASPDPIIEQTRRTLIDEAFIVRMADSIEGPFAHKLRAALEHYQGMTLEDAVNMHSQRLS